MELTLEILEEAISQLPKTQYPRRTRISIGDYRRLRGACDVFKICPEQVGGFTYGFMGEEIVPDETVEDNHYKFEW